MLAARAGLVPGLPLMHPAFYIRPARVEEAAALSDLCFRSKAVWGLPLRGTVPRSRRILADSGSQRTPSG